MKKKQNTTFTYETRLRVTSEEDALLQSYALVMSKAKRKLTAAQLAKAEIDKPAFSQTYGLSSRQFNSCWSEATACLDGIYELKKLELVAVKSKLKL